MTSIGSMKFGMPKWNVNSVRVPLHPRTQRLVMIHIHILVLDLVSLEFESIMSHPSLQLTCNSQDDAKRKSNVARAPAVDGMRCSQARLGGVVTNGVLICMPHDVGQKYSYKS